MPKPTKTDLETISSLGGMLGYQEGSKNALEDATEGARAIVPDPHTTDEDEFWEIEQERLEKEARAKEIQGGTSGWVVYPGQWMGLDLFLECEQAFEQKAQVRETIDNLGNVEKNYGHLYDQVLMALQARLVTTGLWQMITNNLGQPDDYWARRVL